MNAPRLGLRENLAQFSLLLVVNAFVGAMVGMERTILAPIAEQEFHLAAKTAVLSFIVVFGVTKALTNYLAGRLSDRFGRKHVLVGGWILAAPVPFLLMWAPTWSWILFANALLGVSQGLTWSTTVIMKIDLAGPEKRGLAMGLNEFAGYFAVAGSALATGLLAARYGLRPQPFYLGVGFVVIGFLLSALVVRETKHHVAVEAQLHGAVPLGEVLDQRAIFWRSTLFDKNLSSVSQAGLVNNLNDGMAWGLFPLFFTAARMDLAQIGTLAAIYPATWGIAQLFTGAWSDRVGRKWLIASGMWTQALGIGVVVLARGFAGFAIGAALLGVGTAMVYPTLLAAIGDVAHPSWRASAVGVYRLWRDLGYAIGALLAGLAADALGLPAAMWIVAGLTFASGVVVAVRMSETRRGAAAAPLPATALPGSRLDVPYREDARDHLRADDDEIVRRERRAEGVVREATGPRKPREREAARDEPSDARLGVEKGRHDQRATRREERGQGGDRTRKIGHEMQHVGRDHDRERPRLEGKRVEIALETTDVGDVPRLHAGLGRGHHFARVVDRDDLVSRLRESGRHEPAPRAHLEHTRCAPRALCDERDHPRQRPTQQGHRPVVARGVLVPVGASQIVVHAGNVASRARRRLNESATSRG
jgi:MFS family permease